MALTNILIIVAICLVCVESASLKDLPSYLEKCSRRDPYINRCIVIKGNRAIPKITKGDVHFDIPFMQPLFIQPQIILRNDKELYLALRNTLIYGLENTKINSMNFTGTAVRGVLLNPSITVLANYEIKGKLLNTHIFGNGKCNITLEKGVYEYEALLPAVNRDGDYFYQVARPRAGYETVQSHYHFDGLYNGDQFLSGEMNRYMNEHWQEVQRGLRPAASGLVSKIITTALSGIANNVPIKDMFAQ